MQGIGNWKQWIACAVSVATVAALGACRSSKRGVRVGGKEAKLTATLNGLDKEDRKKASNWKYELSGCVPTVNGTFEKPNKVQFKTTGLKKGLSGCQLRVKLPGEIPSDIQFVEGEKRVLYWARELGIEKNADGALVTSVNLTKLYSRKPTDGSTGIWLDVTLKGLEPADQGVSAWIYRMTGCLSGVNGALGADGTVSFQADRLDASKDCKLRIKHLNPPAEWKFKDGEAGVLYYGAFQAQQAQKERRWNGQVTMKKWYQVGSGDAPAGILVETEKGQCEPGEVYDREDRECIEDNQDEGA